MNTSEGVEIWKAAAITALTVLQALAVGMLFYVIKRLDGLSKEGGRTRDRVSKIEGHLEAVDNNFSPSEMD